MSGSKQSKRVSWPTDVNLCQVRLFLNEDAPSQAGLGAQDHLQAKAAWLLHAAGLADSDDSLPPGFESPNKYNPKIEVSQIPLIKWQCPSRFVLNPEWLVVTGEESIEVALENQRESGVLEAIYPRSFSIPPNPSVAPEIQATRIDDAGTPLIPITAIEDEDGTEQLVTTAPQNHDTSMSPNPDKLQSITSASVLGAEPDVLAAASAAFTAIIKSSEEGSLIDRDLLIKILTDPLMVDKLVSEYSAPKPPPPPPPPPSQPPPPPVSFTRSLFQVQNHAPSLAYHHHPAPLMVKDANYYKSLIQLHGGEKQEAQEQNTMQSSSVGNANQRGKVQKPCAYFNTPRGCRHGASCLFLHDASLATQRIEQPTGTVKRIKLDGGIAGRN